MPIKFDLPLVNAHTHAAMVGFRGLAEDMSLDMWLSRYIWAMERKTVTAKFVYKKTKEAIREMKNNGIRVFNDMYFFEEEVARAAIEAKVPAVIGEVILDFPTPSCKTAEEALKKTEKLLIKYKKHPLIKVAVAPHSIYAVSKDILLKAKKLAFKYKTIYHIHLAETKKEFDDCRKKHNFTPVGYLDKLGALDEKSILAHCIWVTDNDLKIIKKRKANIVHCPLSNLKLGSGVAPVTKMLAMGINVALGTDGAASSNRLDIWEAGKFTALLQKGIEHDAAAVSAREVIKMMTINGLKALQIDGIKIRNEFIDKNNFNYLYNAQVRDINFLNL